MSASPFDGYSRTFLRFVLAFVLMADLVFALVYVWSGRSSTTVHPLAPGLFLSIARSTLAVVVIGSAGLAGVVTFFLLPGRSWPGLLSLAAIGLLVETDAAMRGGAQRFLFFGGAALSGWLAGTAFARLLGARSVERIEAYAERGALAALSACYLGALVSKGFAGLWAWGDGSTLRATVLAQHAAGRSAVLDAFTEFVVGSAAVCKLLAWGTLVAQASAVFLPLGAGLRALAASMLLVFHLNVWLLTPIVFPQAMLLLAAFGFPWGPLLQLPRAGGAEDESLDIARALRASAGAGSIAGALCLFGLYGPLRAFSHAGHHDPSPAEASRRQHDAARREKDAPRGSPEIRSPVPEFARGAATVLAARGDVLGYRVVSTSGTARGAFVVALEGRGGRFRVRVEPIVDAARNPPLRAGGRGFYFDSSKGDVLPPATELERVLAEVARAFSPDPSSAGTATNSSQP